MTLRQFKILPLILFFFYSFCLSSFAEIIKKIEIEGNDRVADETILMFSKVNIGDQLDNNNLNDLLKRLYDTNFFKDVSVKFDSNLLTIIVDESPIIENITYNGIKSDTLRGIIINDLELNSRSSYNEILLKNDKNKILSSLKTLGYYFSTVEIEQSLMNNNKVDLIFNIDLGKKQK